MVQWSWISTVAIILQLSNGINDFFGGDCQYEKRTFCMQILCSVIKQNFPFKLSSEKLFGNWTGKALSEALVIYCWSKHVY